LITKLFEEDYLVFNATDRLFNKLPNSFKNWIKIKYDLSKVNFLQLQNIIQNYGKDFDCYESNYFNNLVKDEDLTAEEDVDPEILRYGIKESEMTPEEYKNLSFKTLDELIGHFNKYDIQWKFRNPGKSEILTSGGKSWYWNNETRSWMHL
jgi:hypothetical protein